MNTGARARRGISSGVVGATIARLRRAGLASRAWDAGAGGWRAAATRRRRPA